MCNHTVYKTVNDISFVNRYYYKNIVKSIFFIINTFLGTVIFLEHCVMTYSSACLKVAYVPFDT